MNQAKIMLTRENLQKNIFKGLLITILLIVVVFLIKSEGLFLIFTKN